MLLLFLTSLVSVAGAASLANCQSVYGAYEAFDGSNWLRSYGWPTETGSVADDCCSWEGVNCTDDMVTQVNLFGNLLQGQVPEGLFSGLPGLMVVYLSNNLLQGGIPTELFAGLTNLQEVYLSNNFLQGGIPAELFSGLTNLQWVDLSDNLLQGGIPTELFSGLTNLQWVYLSNNLLQGGIPTELFSGLTNLQEVDLYDNLLQGGIPTELFSGLTNLQWVGLSDNLLQGGIPTELFSDLTKLVVVDLSINELEGQLPSALFQSSKSLEYIALYSNQLSGPIPPDLFKDMKHLTEVDLESNRLSYELPPDLFKSLSSVETIWLNGNRLNGTVPGQLFKDLNNLATVYLGENLLYGALPVHLCKDTRVSADRAFLCCETDTAETEDTANERANIGTCKLNTCCERKFDTKCLANGKYCCSEGEGLSFETGTCAECGNSAVCPADGICCDMAGCGCAKNGFCQPTPGYAGTKNDFCEPRQTELQEKELAPFYFGFFAAVLFVFGVALFLRHVGKKNKACIRLELPEPCRPAKRRPDDTVLAPAHDGDSIATGVDADQVRKGCKCDTSTPLHQKYDDLVSGDVLPKDVDLAAVDCAGRTLLHLAIQMEAGWALLKALLMHKKLRATVHMKDKKGRTSLHYACHVASETSAAVIEELLKFAGKETSTEIKGGIQGASRCYAFHSAVRAMVAAARKLMTKISSDQVPTARLRDRNGWTPLQLAFYMPPPTEKDDPNAKAAEAKAAEEQKREQERRQNISYMLLESYPKEGGGLLPRRGMSGAGLVPEKKNNCERRVCDLLQRAMRQATFDSKNRHVVTAILERCPDIDYSNAMQSMAYCLATGKMIEDAGALQSSPSEQQTDEGAMESGAIRMQIAKELSPQEKANLKEVMKDVIWQATDAYDYTEGTNEHLADKEGSSPESAHAARQVIEEMIAEHKHMKELLDGDASFGVWSIMFIHPRIQSKNGKHLGPGKWNGIFIKFTCTLTLLSQLAISVVLFVGLIDVQLQQPHIEGYCPLRVYEPDYDERNKCWKEDEFRLDAIMQRLLICAISILYLSRFQMLYTRKVLSDGTLSKGQLKAIEMYNKSRLGIYGRFDEFMDIYWEGTVYVMNLLFLLSTNSILEMVLNSLALEFVANLDNEYKEHYMKVYGGFIRGVIRRKQLLDHQKTESDDGSTSMSKKWENWIGYGIWDCALRLFMVAMLVFFSIFIFYSPICKFQVEWNAPPEDESYVRGCRKMALPF